jgi:hypothetical protein
MQTHRCQKILLSVILLLSSCNINQKNNTTIYATERFDTKLIDSLKQKAISTNGFYYETEKLHHYLRIEYVDEDGSFVRAEERDLETDIASIDVYYPAPTFLVVTKEYYPGNRALGIEKQFVGAVPVGKARYYDKKGNLLQEIDEDKKFGKIKIEDILRFLEKEKHLDLKTGKGWYDCAWYEENSREDDGDFIFGGGTLIDVAFVPSQESVLLEGDIPSMWYITIKAYNYPYIYTDYIINGDTGEVLKKREEQRIPDEL